MSRIAEIKACLENKMPRNMNDYQHSGDVLRAFLERTDLLESHCEWLVEQVKELKGILQGVEDFCTECPSCQVVIHGSDEEGDYVKNPHGYGCEIDSALHGSEEQK